MPAQNVPKSMAAKASSQTPLQEITAFLKLLNEFIMEDTREMNAGRKRKRIDTLSYNE